MSNRKGERNHWRIRESWGFERLKTSKGVKGHTPPRPASFYLQRLEPRKAAHSHSTDALVPLKNWTNSTGVKGGWRCGGACTVYLVEMHMDKSSLKQFYTRRVMFLNELQHPVTDLHPFENWHTCPNTASCHLYLKYTCCIFIQLPTYFPLNESFNFGKSV